MIVRSLVGRGDHASDRIATRSTWLLLGKYLQMGAGFLFWIVAARNADVTQVGLAAATASAVILCSQLSIFGAGSAVIVALGRDEEPQRVLDAALTLVLGASVVAGSGYLTVVLTIGTGAGSAVEPGALLVVVPVAVVSGTAIICIDQASLALHHSEASVVRYGCGGLVSLGAVAALAAGSSSLDVVAIVACWALGSVVACLLGTLQLRRWIDYRYRPSLKLGSLAVVIRRGLPHHLLTLTERLPPALVPLLLAYVASPEATAYWYPAWMMAWVVFLASINAGLVQFSDGVRAPEDLRRIVVHGLASSLLLGSAGAVVLALFAEQALGLMGPEYAAASTDALRVLLLGVIPFAVLQGYFAVCRATDRVREGVTLGCVSAVAICLGTALTGGSGPTVVAWVWVVSTAVPALWAARRLRSLTVRATGRPGEQRPVPGLEARVSHD